MKGLSILISVILGCASGFLGYPVFENGYFNVKNFLFLALCIIMTIISCFILEIYLENRKERMK